MINVYYDTSIKKIKKKLKKYYLVISISLLFYGFLITLILMKRTLENHYLFLFMTIVISIIEVWGLIYIVYALIKPSKKLIKKLNDFAKIKPSFYIGILANVKKDDLTLNGDIYYEVFLNVAKETIVVYWLKDYFLEHLIKQTLKVEVKSQIVMSYEMLSR